MRRATNPATCTTVNSRPVRVVINTALRSFSLLDLFKDAFTNLPAVYCTSVTLPEIGERCECTLNIFMKILIFNALV